MTKIILALTIAFAGVSVFAVGQISKEIQSIADNAQVANGDTTVSFYDIKKLDYEKAFANKVNEVKKQYKKKCGPYKTTTSRRTSIAAVAKEAYDDVTAQALKKLYDEKKIAKIYTVITNNEIDCSRMWVEVYTFAGEHLEIYYGMND